MGGQISAATPIRCKRRYGVDLRGSPRCQNRLRPRPWWISSTTISTVRCGDQDAWRRSLKFMGDGLLAVFRSRKWSAIPNRSVRTFWKPPASRAPKSTHAIRDPAKPRALPFRVALHVGQFFNGNIGAATGSTSPASGPPSILPRGWKDRRPPASHGRGVRGIRSRCAGAWSDLGEFRLRDSQKPSGVLRARRRGCSRLNRPPLISSDIPLRRALNCAFLVLERHTHHGQGLLCESRPLSRSLNYRLDKHRIDRTTGINVNHGATRTGVETKVAAIADGENSSIMAATTFLIRIISRFGG